MRSLEGARRCQTTHRQARSKCASAWSECGGKAEEETRRARGTEGRSEKTARREGAVRRRAGRED